jgi:hypothetical protein
MNEKILGFRESQQKEWISEKTWKEIGKRKCKQKQNKTTEN